MTYDTIIYLTAIWLLLGYAGWVLTITNTKNNQWRGKINADKHFKAESRFFHVIFGLFSLISGIIHSI